VKTAVKMTLCVAFRKLATRFPLALTAPFVSSFRAVVPRSW
jgi:hypothetical protein